MSRKRTRSEQYREVDRQGFWKLLKEAYGEIPQEVNAQDATTTVYYKQLLINAIKSNFVVQCPDWWSVDYMLDLLILGGHFYVSNSAAGILPFFGNSHGINVFDRPPHSTLVNSILGTMDRVLTGTTEFASPNAAVVYLYDDREYRSMIPLINRYSQRLANIDASIDINLLNTRTAFMFNCEDSKQSAEAKAVYDKIARGEPAVFTKVKKPLDDPRDSGIDITILPVKENYIVDKLIDARYYILSQFYTEIGINSTPYEKKERQVVDEVNSNVGQQRCNIAYMQRNLERCSENVRKMFNIDFNIEYKPERLNETPENIFNND